MVLLCEQCSKHYSGCLLMVNDDSGFWLMVNDVDDYLMIIVDD